MVSAHLDGPASSAIELAEPWGGNLLCSMACSPDGSTEDKRPDQEGGRGPLAVRPVSQVIPRVWAGSMGRQGHAPLEPMHLHFHFASAMISPQVCRQSGKTGRGGQELGQVKQTPLSI